MALPKFEDMLRPALVRVKDAGEMKIADIIDGLAREFELTTEELEQLQPSGREPVFRNRVRWSLFYLRHAGFLRTVRRGCVAITDEGRNALQKHKALTVKDLKEVEAFKAWKQRPSETEPVNYDIVIGDTPEEQMRSLDILLRAALASDLLEQVKNQSPKFFEQLVIDVLQSLGYGGSHEDAAQALGKSGDGGVDGVIKEDPLGLDVIYIQAKRWEGSVGRPVVQQFLGALVQHRAKKGVLISTSFFTAEAVECAKSSDPKVVLINGMDLANFMIDHNIGVTPVASYSIKKVDSDFFSEV